MSDPGNEFFAGFVAGTLVWALLSAVFIWWDARKDRDDDPW